MNTQDFINTLQNPQFEQWIQENAQNFIKGGAGFQREVKISAQIAELMPSHVLAERGGRRDFSDSINKDNVGEAAHNGTYQSATHGPEHLIKRAKEYFDQGLKGDFFGLMYLLDILKIQNDTAFSNAYHGGIGKTDPKEVRALMDQFPGRLQFEYSTPSFSSAEEPNTAFKYHFYIVNFKLNQENMDAIDQRFGGYPFYKRTE